jgi:ankyrin repeat protein
MQPVHRILPMISALLEAGASPTAVNNQMQTPLHVLLMGVMTAIEGLSNDYSYQDSCNWRNEKRKRVIQHFSIFLVYSVRCLLKHGADLSSKNVKGRDPL